VPTPDHEEMEEIAERAATKAIATVFTSIGIDISKPIEAQRDFHALRELSKLAADPELQKDLQHMRIWRTRTETMTTKGMLAVLTAAVGGVATVFVYGLQNILNVVRPPH
jgi:hypothetical protein